MSTGRKSGGGSVAVGVFVLVAFLLASGTQFDRIVAAAQGVVGKAAEVGQPAQVSQLPTDQQLCDTRPRPRDQLDCLTVIPRPSRDGTYQRSTYGKAWADTDGNGCNQRDDVLFRDVDKTAPFTAARQGACTHDMLAGTWHDPYSGKRMVFTDLKDQRQSQAIQIDHVVALGVADRYGARDWSSEKRLAFATDLDNLLAVDGPANVAKSDGDAAQWRPRAAGGAQCTYATRYTYVKAKYGLPVDKSEKNALLDMLETCPR